MFQKTFVFLNVFYRGVLLFKNGFSFYKLKGNFITPKLVGDRIGLHPAWIMFALLASGALFGFTGILLAVPLAAVIGVLGRFAIQQYKRSGAYLGPPGAQEQEEVVERDGPGNDANE